MRRLILAVTLLFSTLFSTQQGFSRPVESILNFHSISPQSTAVHAVWADTGEMILSHQKELPLIPASSAKLITTYCALRELGVDHRFKTKFLSEGAIQQGKIASLTVWGEGDPSMTSESLWAAVQQLKAYGIQEITGDIYIDDSTFDKNGYPGRQENNKRAYNALTSALSLNFNSVAVLIRPTGSKVHVSLFPDIPYLKFKNNLKGGGRANVFVKNDPAGQGLASPGREAKSLDFAESNDFETITVGGTFPLRGRPMTLYRSIHNPPLFFGYALKQSLAESGISVKGSVKVTKGPGKNLIWTHVSKPFSEIVRDINKFSNNFMAEQVTKYLGAKAFGVPGTTEKGTESLKKCLLGVGVDSSNFQIENGSGLSYQNRISAESLVKVLLAGYRNFDIQPDYIASLSVAGVDGTMRIRNSKQGLGGHLRAKTGTLNGISSLAGYIPTVGGRLVAFAIIMNDLKGGGVGQSHQIQDSLVYNLSLLK